jgi:hypothetical protein
MRKLTQEEHSSVLSIQQTVVTLFTEVGQLYLKKSVLQSELDVIEGELKSKQNEFNKVGKEQSELYNKLLEKYGEGEFDPETGEFK